MVIYIYIVVSSAHCNLRVGYMHLTILSKPPNKFFVSGKWFYGLPSAAAKFAQFTTHSD